MKKICFLLLLVICALIAAIIYLLNSNMKQTTYTLNQFEAVHNYVECKLWQDTMTEEMVCQGIVTGTDYVLEKECPFNRDYKIFAESGKVIEPEEVVMQADNKQITFDHAVRIVSFEESVKETEEETENGIKTVKTKIVTITYLDYDKLYIEADFPADMIDLIDCQTQFTAFQLKQDGDEITEDRQLHDVTISQIGYEVTSHIIPVRFKVSELLLPGTETAMHLNLRTYKDQWIIRNEFISQDSNGYYLTYLEGDIPKDVYIQIIYQDDEQTAIKIDEQYLERTFISNEHN